MVFKYSFQKKKYINKHKIKRAPYQCFPHHLNLERKKKKNQRIDFVCLLDGKKLWFFLFVFQPFYRFEIIFFFKNSDHSFIKKKKRKKMATIVIQEMEQPRPSTSKGIIRLYSFFLLSAHFSSCCSSLFCLAIAVVLIVWSNILLNQISVTPTSNSFIPVFFIFAPLNVWKKNLFFVRNIINKE